MKFCNYFPGSHSKNPHQKYLSKGSKGLKHSTESPLQVPYLGSVHVFKVKDSLKAMTRVGIWLKILSRRYVDLNIDSSLQTFMWDTISHMDRKAFLQWLSYGITL